MKLTPEQIDNLQEVINIGVGQAAGILNEMLDSHIVLEIPELRQFTPKFAKQQLVNRLGEGVFSTIELRFFGSVKGNADLVFPNESAVKLVELITDRELENDDSDWDSLKIGALTEIGNIVISGIMGAISNLLSQDLQYFLPDYLEGDIETIFQQQYFQSERALLLAKTRFSIEEKNIEGEILLMFQVETLPVLLLALEKLLN